MIKKFHGFTFVELMITLSIVAILTIIAFANYSSSVRQGRRSDAFDAFNGISLAEERYRSSNTTYGTLAQVWGGTTTSAGGYYTLSISNVSATSYTITATANSAQANDKEGSTTCSPLSFAYSNGAITKSPSVCWPS